MMFDILELALDGKTDIFAAEGLDSIYNCLCTIAETRIGSVPLYRHFGTAWEWTDYPLPTAMARYRAELMEAIDLYEPRVEILSITFRADKEQALNGQLTPVIRFRLKEGVTL